MQSVLLTPRIVVNSIFILYLALMIAYAIELVQCNWSKRKPKRIYGILICAWSLFLGAYVLFALANAIGIIVILIGIFIFRWNKRITDKLFLLPLLTLCLHVSALN